MEFRKTRPMALVLPSLYSELEGPALSSIVDELSHVPYLEQIVVGLDRATEDQFRHSLEFFNRLPQRPIVLWNDGPRLRRIVYLLESHGLAPQEMGKGRNVWYMFGYILASGKAQAVALHDCDITTYKRDMLARLIYPVANPEFSYKFCKGYYARVAKGSMNGRVCRLLVTPLIRALKKVCGSNDYLDYLDSFRYALAGEFSLQRDVIEDIRIPSDWGLEMGVISEMHRNYSTRMICQVDIASTYDHKHQELSPDDRNKGLSKMTSDISKSMFRKMATRELCFPRKPSARSRRPTIESRWISWIVIIPTPQLTGLPTIAIGKGKRWSYSLKTYWAPAHSFSSTRWQRRSCRVGIAWFPQFRISMTNSWRRWRRMRRSLVPNR